MELYSIFQGGIYSLMAVTGSLGNLSILLSLTHSAYKEGRFPIPELILSHIAGSNLVVFLTRALPSSLSAFGYRDLYSDLGCKIISVVFRTCRGAVICLTCLLSCYQGITISGNSPKGMQSRELFRKLLLSSILLIYFINLVSNVDSILFAVSVSNRSTPPYTFNIRYCLIIFPNKVTFEAVGLINFVQDLVPVLIMAAASAYMLLVLYQHKKVAQGLRRSDQPQGKTAESQATKTVVTLVTLYVTFYGIDNAIWLYQTFSKEILTVISDIRIFFTMCYGFVFPFITITFNPKFRNKLKNRRDKHAHHTTGATHAHL